MGISSRYKIFFRRTNIIGMFLKLPGELIYSIVEYLDTPTLYSLSKVCQYTRFYSVKEIRKRTVSFIENEAIFYEEKDILYWMLERDYFILHVVEEKDINKKYMDLWFFYLDKRYIERIYNTNLKIMYQIQKLSEHFIAL
jgi:hypothetical protein